MPSKPLVIPSTRPYVYYHGLRNSFEWSKETHTIPAGAEAQSLKIIEQQVSLTKFVNELSKNEPHPEITLINYNIRFEEFLREMRDKEVLQWDRDFYDKRFILPPDLARLYYVFQGLGRVEQRMGRDWDGSTAVLDQVPDETRGVPSETISPAKTRRARSQSMSAAEVSAGAKLRTSTWPLEKQSQQEKDLASLRTRLNNKRRQQRLQEADQAAQDHLVPEWQKWERRRLQLYDDDWESSLPSPSRTPSSSNSSTSSHPSSRSYTRKSSYIPCTSTIHEEDEKAEGINRIRDSDIDSAQRPNPRPRSRSHLTQERPTVVTIVDADPSLRRSSQRASLSSRDRLGLSRSQPSTHDYMPSRLSQSSTTPVDVMMTGSSRSAPKRRNSTSGREHRDSKSEVLLGPRTSGTLSFLHRFARGL